MIARIIKKYHQRRAMKRLDQIVRQTRASEAHRQYLKHSAAAKLGHARRKGVAHG
jgi:hypothetical protein